MKRKTESLAALFLLLPSLIGLCAFFLVPFLDTIRRSFYDTRGQRFIGAEGYTSVLSKLLLAAQAGIFIAHGIVSVILIRYGLIVKSRIR